MQQLPLIPPISPEIQPADSDSDQDQIKSHDDSALLAFHLPPAAPKDDRPLPFATRSGLHYPQAGIQTGASDSWRARGTRRAAAAARGAAAALLRSAWLMLHCVLRLVLAVWLAPIALVFGGWYKHNRCDWGTGGWYDLV